MNIRDFYKIGSLYIQDDLDDMFMSAWAWWWTAWILATWFWDDAWVWDDTDVWID